MFIRVTCVCGKTYKVKDDQIAKRAKCASCGAVFVIPDPVQQEANSRVASLLRDLDRRDLSWQSACDARGRATQEITKMGRLAVQPLLHYLDQGDNYNIKLEVITILGQLGDPRAVQPLLSYAQSHRHVKQAVGKAAEALVRLGVRRDEDIVLALGDVRDFQSLSEALCKGVLHVQVEAAVALGQLGDKRAVEPLIAMLKTAVPEVREAAVSALGKLADRRAVAPLREELRRSLAESDWNLRVNPATIKQALETLGDR